MKHTLSTSAKRIIAVFLAVAMIVGIVLIGTYAWSDKSQFKTNAGSGKGISNDVTLNDEFPLPGDWSVDDGDITKIVSVTNPGTATDAAYVRLVFKEYLEILNANEAPSTVRYATSPDGDYAEIGHFYAYQNGGTWKYGAYDVDGVVQYGYVDDSGITSFKAILLDTDVDDTGFDDWAELIGYHSDSPASRKSASVITDFATGDVGWFIKTQEGDIDGQYGKYASIPGTPFLRILPDDTILRGVYNPGDTLATAYDPTELAGEFAYTPYNFKYSEGENFLFTPAGAANIDIRYFVQWTLGDGTNFVLYSDWEDDGFPTLTSTWIVDDVTDGTPYIYWSDPLTAGQTTSNIIESIKLLHQPEGPFYYALHIDLEAVDQAELALWTSNTYKDKYIDLPQGLYDYWVPAAVTLDLDVEWDEWVFGEDITAIDAAAWYLTVSPASAEPDVRWSLKAVDPHGDTVPGFSIDAETGLITGPVDTSAKLIIKAFIPGTTVSDTVEVVLWYKIFDEVTLKKLISDNGGYGCLTADFDVGLASKNNGVYAVSGGKSFHLDGDGHTITNANETADTNIFRFVNDAGVSAPEKTVIIENLNTIGSSIKQSRTFVVETGVYKITLDNVNFNDPDNGNYSLGTVSVNANASQVNLEIKDSTITGKSGIVYNGMSTATAKSTINIINSTITGNKREGILLGTSGLYVTLNFENSAIVGYGVSSSYASYEGYEFLEGKAIYPALAIGSHYSNVVIDDATTLTNTTVPNGGTLALGTYTVSSFTPTPDTTTVTVGGVQLHPAP
ncbi:MAG: hypothetical protein LBN02_05550 [Oscillospiraceae bacterium]|jgi:hypothetical protein|nr:hypothetical protein [Oscillospiraceae bacterium]